MMNEGAMIIIDKGESMTISKARVRMTRCITSTVENKGNIKEKNMRTFGEE